MEIVVKDLSEFLTYWVPEGLVLDVIIRLFVSRDYRRKTSRR